MNAEYPQRFVDLLNNYKGGTSNNYIGQGNPGAKILIIGKECTAQNIKDVGNFYDFEIIDNFETWKINNTDKKDFCEVQDWDNTPIPLKDKYNPLFPYNSWWFGGKINHGIRHGSRTWDGYQTILNHIYPEYAIQKHEPYNLWQHCFITELSTNNMDISKKNKNTAQSINVRLQSKDGILRQDFFQKFPIIIFAVYQYKDWYNIDIEKCFDQKYIKSYPSPELIENHEFIHEHQNLSDKQHPRLLIHTNHAVHQGCCLHTKKYYEQLGEICRNFLNKYYSDDFVISK